MEKRQNFLDFRSDTVTQPTEAMRRAMASAEVGDDVYGEDPTVNQLQELASELTGHEAGLFVPSGTMGNLASILAHCNRGDEIIVGDRAHIFLFEAAGAAALGGINIRTAPNLPNGKLSPEQLAVSIRPEDVHQPITRLVALENTHNRCDGISMDAGYTQEIADFAVNNGLAFHIDGARIFNAAVDLMVEVADLTRMADSVTFCLSKGLSAPAGSVICGSREFIKKAHRIRKQLGGSMRQAGVLAAAGIVALTSMVTRLEEDHHNAKLLASGLSEIEQVVIDTENQHTNMVYFFLKPEVGRTLDQLRRELHQRGLLVSGGSDRIRMVTHYGLRTEDVRTAIRIIKDSFSGSKK
jgi:threonine aldolase